MARGERTENHPNRRPQKPTLPAGYGNYSDSSTFDAQRNTDREFDRQEYAYNEQMKRSK
jgi:hypothetical protein